MTEYLSEEERWAETGIEGGVCGRHREKIVIYKPRRKARNRAFPPSP